MLLRLLLVSCNLFAFTITIAFTLEVRILRFVGFLLGDPTTLYRHYGWCRCRCLFRKTLFKVNKHCMNFTNCLPLAMHIIVAYKLTIQILIKGS